MEQRRDELASVNSQWHKNHPETLNRTSLVQVDETRNGIVLIPARPLFYKSASKKLCSALRAPYLRSTKSSNRYFSKPTDAHCNWSRGPRNISMEQRRDELASVYFQWHKNHPETFNHTSLVQVDETRNGIVLIPNFFSLLPLHDMAIIEQARDLGLAKRELIGFAREFVYGVQWEGS
jgi:hypothetical protein